MTLLASPNEGAMAHVAKAGHALQNDEDYRLLMNDLCTLYAVAEEHLRPEHRGPRAPYTDLLRARWRIEDGATADVTIVRYNLTHPQDVAKIRALAERVLRSERAKEAIRSGASPDEAIATYGLTHGRDIAKLRGLAAQLA